MKEKKEMPIYDVEGGSCKAVFLRDKIVSGFSMKKIKKILAADKQK